MSALIMIAITLVAGAAVFSFVNGAAGNSAKAVGNSVASNINFLNEREVIVAACWASSGGSCEGGDSGGSSLGLYVYNNGAISPETMNEISLTNSTSGANCCWTNSSLTQASSNPCDNSSSDSNLASVTISKQQVGGYLVTPSGAKCSMHFGDSEDAHSYTLEIIGEYGSSAQYTVEF
jgi:hypothetical protein